MLSTLGKAAVRRVAGRGAVGNGRVHYQLLNGSTIRTLSQSSHAVNLRLSLALRRSYATAAPAKSKGGRPRVSKDGEGKPKKPVKKKTTKAPAKGRSALAKKSKKTATKPKKKIAVKKVLTEEQLAKRAAAAQTKQRVQLKATALLNKEPKQLPQVAWPVFLGDYVHKNYATSSAPTSSKLSTLAKDASAEYKSLSTAEREALNHKAIENEKINKAAYKEWVETYTPEQIRQANLARLHLKRAEKAATGGARARVRYGSIRDDRQPVRPALARNQFIASRWASGDLKGIPLKETASQLHKEFDALSASEKQAFEDAYQADKRRYQQEYLTVFGKSVRSHTTK